MPRYGAGHRPSARALRRHARLQVIDEDSKQSEGEDASRRDSSGNRPPGLRRSTPNCVMDQPAEEGQRGAAELMEQARAARGRAYAPYSGFSVGAALRDADGRIHTGVNVENASYGLTICAERAAVFRAVAEGARSFRAIAIAGPEDDAPCPPCGACRQVLHELAPSIDVIVAGPDGSFTTLSLGQLLPNAFGPSELGAASPSRPVTAPDRP